MWFVRRSSATRGHRLAWLAVLAASGCTAGHDGNTIDPSARALTCEVIAGPNCWKAAVAAIAACAPGTAAAGTLSADGKTCSYPAGDQATFDTDALAAISTHAPLSFTLTRHGALCAAFDDTGAQLTLRSPLGMVAWGGDKITTLDCPDGTRYQAETVAVVSCPGFLDHSYVTISSATWFQLELMARPANVPVMTCAR